MATERKEKYYRELIFFNKFRKNNVNNTVKLTGCCLVFIFPLPLFNL